MKRIFLTSALLLSFLSFGQPITELIEKETAQELKYEAEDSKGACDSFKPREEKEKQECIKYWDDRVKLIKKNREDALRDLSTYYQNKEILLSKIKEANDHLLIHPEDYDFYTEGIISAHKIYARHIQKCVNNYSWGMELYNIIVKRDSAKIYKVTIRKLKETDFK